MSALEYAEDHLEMTETILNVANGIQNVMAADALRGECLARLGSAIDVYFHVRVRLSMFNNGLSPAARKLSVPLGEIDDMVTHVVDNREKATRPRARLIRTVRDRLRRRTFQGTDGIEEAASLIPLGNIWTNLADEMGHGETAKTVKERVRELYRIRNIVSHEGGYDIGSSLRPQQIQYWSITDGRARDDLAWTRSLIAAIDRL